VRLTTLGVDLSLWFCRFRRRLSFTYMFYTALIGRGRTGADGCTVKTGGHLPTPLESKTMYLDQYFTDRGIV
jgi:hypothetical protein